MPRSNNRNRVATLEYTLTRRSRVTKRLHMELDEQGGLVVVAPGHWSRRHVEATLAHNIHRVEAFFANAREKYLEPLQYVNEEKHLYLGEYYTLAIHHEAVKRNSIDITEGVIRIYASPLQSEKIKSSLQDWYRCEAKKIFSERLAVVAQRTPWVKERTPVLKLRRMKRTWGNCSSKGVIKLNTHLVKAPLSVIDSVIAHELCHLEEMNHGKAFYALLENLNPNWREDRASLRASSSFYLLT